MAHLIIGSLVLSLIHAAIPNHWLPILVIARAEYWNRRETLGITALTGFFHVFSTILIGISLGLLGLKLSESYHAFTTTLAPVILILMGLAYLLWKDKKGHAPASNLSPGGKTSKGALITTLCLAMLFSPCLEIDTYFISAGAHGWEGIAAVSLVYLTVTITSLVVLVALAFKGIEQFGFGFLERHHKKVTGMVLILLGVVSFFLH